MENWIIISLCITKRQWCGKIYRSGRRPFFSLINRSVGWVAWIKPVVCVYSHCCRVVRRSNINKQDLRRQQQLPLLLQSILICIAVFFHSPDGGGARFLTPNQEHDLDLSSSIQSCVGGAIRYLHTYQLWVNKSYNSSVVVKISTKINRDQ